MENSLKELRLKSRMTQKEAADYLKVSLRTYKTYENDPEKVSSIKYTYMVEQLQKLIFVDETHGVLDVKVLKRISSALCSQKQKRSVPFVQPTVCWQKTLQILS